MTLTPHGPDTCNSTVCKATQQAFILRNQKSLKKMMIMTISVTIQKNTKFSTQLKGLDILIAYLEILIAYLIFEIPQFSSFTGALPLWCQRLTSFSKVMYFFVIYIHFSKDQLTFRWSFEKWMESCYFQIQFKEECVILVGRKKGNKIQSQEKLLNFSTKWDWNAKINLLQVCLFVISQEPNKLWRLGFWHWAENFLFSTVTVVISFMQNPFTCKQ